MSTRVMDGQITLFELLIPAAELNDSKGGQLKTPTSGKTKREVAGDDQRKSLSPMQKFIKQNDGIVIEDDITVTSKSFKSFCTKLRNALKKEAQLLGFDSVSLTPGHYDMHGFFNKGDRYVYWSFSVERYDNPTDLKRNDYMHGVLYRTAKSEKDSRGGYNNYTTLERLCSDAYSLITK